LGSSFAYGFGNLTTASTALGTTTAASVINFYQVEQLTFLWVLFVMIVVGNATVLGALLLSKGHKSRMNFFIKHLAAADLCVGLISVLTDIIWKITISWDAGNIACKLIRFSQCVVTYSSTYVLVALSIDRYDAITHPMNFSGSWRRARYLVAAAWILSAVFSSPTLYFFHTADITGYGTQCWINFQHQWQWQVYMTLIALTLFVIPAILISACYIIIVCTIWKKGKAMHTANGGAAASRQSSAATTADDEQESRRASSRGLIPKAKVKTVKMTICIISVFILCWIPYIVFDLLQVYGLIPQNSTTWVAVATFIQSMAPLNSAANPLIYCLFSTNIGATICNILCCRKKPEILPTGLTTSTNTSLLSNTSDRKSVGDRPSVTFRSPTSEV
jgi:neuropeptide S receptor 1